MTVFIMVKDNKVLHIQIWGKKVYKGYTSRHLGYSEHTCSLEFLCTINFHCKASKTRCTEFPFLAFFQWTIRMKLWSSCLFSKLFTNWAIHFFTFVHTHIGMPFKSLTSWTVFPTQPLLLDHEGIFLLMAEL